MGLHKAHQPAHHEKRHKERDDKTNRDGCSIIVCQMPTGFIEIVVAASMVGMARKNENSAAALRSTPIISAPMMVAPERETPGTMAMHCMKPMASAVLARMPSVLVMVGAGLMRSMTRMAMPPTMRAMATTLGLNKAVLMMSCAKKPMAMAGKNASRMLRTKCCASALRRWVSTLQKVRQ
jgi:hypothetical protein